MKSLDDATVRHVLATSMVVHLATVSPKARPFVTPIWFVVDDGAIYMTTGVETRAARNVAVHPDVTLLFGGEPEWPDIRVRLSGHATCHRGMPPWRVLLRIAAKYYLAPAALGSELRNASRWLLRMRYYAGVKGGAGHLRVVPIGVETLYLR